MLDEHFFKNLPSQPGVYQLLDKYGKILYVGKAKNLKKRVRSYFQKNVDRKTSVLVKKIEDVTVTITRTEKEALLLENNLIKKFKPKYNIIFKDDKTYPYICLSFNDKYPRIFYYRGELKKENKYFGPYSNPQAAKTSIDLIQKIFQLRNCTNSYFKNRVKPCLQYQLKLCTAPCVNFISEQDYNDSVNQAVLLLKGKSDKIFDELVKKMEKASREKNYELAIKYRDSISSLRALQSEQSIMNFGIKNKIDVFAINYNIEMVCIHVVSAVNGQIDYSKQFFYNSPANLDSAESILQNFILQYYLSRKNKINVKKVEIISSLKLDETNLIPILEQSFEDASFKVKFNPTGDRKKWLDMAIKSAESGIKLKNQFGRYAIGFFEMKKALNLDSLPNRLECFDVSHISGKFAVASCVSMDINGLVKSDYKKFNIQSVDNGDDYLAMREALGRRYSKYENIPDVLVIDGGKGQLSQAMIISKELNLDLNLISIAKGPERKVGLEKFFSPEKEIDLSNFSEAKRILQIIRDEAHRFAITSHRKKREKIKSTLEKIPGIGAKRRTSLLQHFGGISEIENASIEDLQEVEGINLGLAKIIYEFFHS